ncbi:MAG: hypothetical protein A3D74_02090 [Candidatus Levybacteria bacterium RIFCSPHIGHO2_02_FULL_37_13]|nr:MAG: hypothetical protein A3D74_02090 [Candidatus Levybacteria bacterium RIFCSPHIGHO2_02_FULL_37_13]OGH30717.1 MAG: hypothetical protein A3E40_02455 [Candidatus Levybacteria bacterium RIFCSPHIGHO2_12_FULL_37_9]OGH38341.1 MAG: hypothetical protein A3B41_02070 [Candidatus Levybacteria bacterium RIFCSPLOWO2_01_FULL_37_26]
MILKNYNKKHIIFLTGFATFFFGFGAGAILNLYLLAINSPLVLQLRSSLMFVSSILGDGVILPVVNMFIVSSLIKNKEFISKLKIFLSLLFGLLITLYFHITQAVQGLVNWSMPKPWEWNLLGVWHALYMLVVTSLISLFYIILAFNIVKFKRFTKEAVLVTLGIVLFVILLRLDYIGVRLI